MRRAAFLLQLLYYWSINRKEQDPCEGSDSVILPCKTTPDLPEDIRVEWTRSEPELMMVHMYTNRGDQLNTQDGLYRDRTEMNEDLLRTGDLSLTLKLPTERDTGGYICTIYRDKDILRQKVLLQVKGQRSIIQNRSSSNKRSKTQLNQLINCFFFLISNCF
uniref:Ig-like domain-containing protein n=1 Tax=Amphilophus citrinellus TaxID=61819 RepID=A0A3Q0QPW7_AMPCI